MVLRFKVKYEGATFMLSDIPDNATFGDLKHAIYGKTMVDAAFQSIRGGFPPTEFTGEPSQCLSELGISNGSMLTVSIRDPIVNTVDGIGSAESKEQDMPPSPSSATYLALKDMGFSKTQALRAEALAGGELQAAVDLAMSGAADGDEEAAAAAAAQAEAPRGGGGGGGGGRRGGGRRFVRRVIDADNSCLFNAVGYVFERNRKAAPRLRRLIANTVLGNPDKWTEAILGKPPHEYQSWIQDPQKWGGEIELAILCQFFASEIVVVDIQSLNTYKYGSEFNQRAFLLYDGVHYDAMAEALESQGEKKSEDTDVTVFDSSDESRISAALDVAAELKARNQFVNLAGCDLKCLVCGRGLKGQAGALEHARATSHQNFGQI